MPLPRIPRKMLHAPCSRVGPKTPLLKQPGRGNCRKNPLQAKGMVTHPAHAPPPQKEATWIPRMPLRNRVEG